MMRYLRCLWMKTHIIIIKIIPLLTCSTLTSPNARRFLIFFLFYLLFGKCKKFPFKKLLVLPRIYAQCIHIVTFIAYSCSKCFIENNFFNKNLLQLRGYDVLHLRHIWSILFTNWMQGCLTALSIANRPSQWLWLDVKMTVEKSLL